MWIPERRAKRLLRRAERPWPAGGRWVWRNEGERVFTYTGPAWAWRFVRVADNRAMGRILKARELLARRWLDRDPALLAVLRKRGTRAYEELAMWSVNALYEGRLDDRPSAAHGIAIGPLLDADEKARMGTARAWANVRPPFLDVLWTVLPSATGSEREVLLKALQGNPKVPGEPALDEAWRLWLDDPSDALWELLRTLGRPASIYAGWETSELSRLVLGSASPDELWRAVDSESTPGHVRRIVAAICTARELPPPEQDRTDTIP